MKGWAYTYLTYLYGITQCEITTMMKIKWLSSNAIWENAYHIPFVQESKDEQWKRAMDYLNVVNELNYMTQIVIMLYEDPNKVTRVLDLLPEVNK